VDVELPDKTEVVDEVLRLDAGAVDDTEDVDVLELVVLLTVSVDEAVGEGETLEELEEGEELEADSVEDVELETDELDTLVSVLDEVVLESVVVEEVLEVLLPMVELLLESVVVDEVAVLLSVLELELRVELGAEQSYVYE
jgi:hypothetical protein